MLACHYRGLGVSGTEAYLPPTTFPVNYLYHPNTNAPQETWWSRSKAFCAGLDLQTARIGAFFLYALPFLQL